MFLSRKRLHGVVAASALFLSFGMTRGLLANCDSVYSGQRHLELRRGWTYQVGEGGALWQPVPQGAPGLWTDDGIAPPPGTNVTYRCRIFLSGRAPSGIAIDLGLIRSMDVAYFNHQEIGQTGDLNTGRVDVENTRLYSIPDRLWLDGENVLEVRMRGVENVFGTISSDTGFHETPALTDELDRARQLFVRDSPKIIFSCVYLLVAAFFAVFYAFFWHRRENLFFALFSLMLAAYNLIRTDLRYEFFDTFEVSFQSELLALFFLPVLFLEYLHNLIDMRRARALWILYAAYAVLIAVTFLVGARPEYWRLLINVNLVLVTIVLAIVAAIFYTRYAEHRHQLRYIAFGFVLVVPFVIYDIFGTLGIAPGYQLSVFGFLLFLGSVSLQLSDSILSLYSSIQEQEQELRQLEKKKTRSIYNISSEFHRILTGLREGLMALSENGNGQAKSTRKKAAARRNAPHNGDLKSSFASLENLVNDSTLLSLLEQGDYSVRHVNFSLRRLCEDTLERALLTTGQPRKRLLTDLPPEEEEIASDPDLISAAIYHLVENGLLYTLGKLEVAIKLQPGLLRVYVRDEGPGIESAQKEAVFQKFVRGSDDPSAPVGSGIGLAIVELIAEEMGGEVRLETGAGFFSTFTFVVPLL